MLTQERIDQFYKDVESLRLKRPVAVISEKTGFSKGNVSSYLNKKLSPSENFIKKFYESFNLTPESLKLESKKVEQNVNEDDYLGLVKMMVSDLRKLNDQKEADLVALRSAVTKIDNIESRVNEIESTVHGLSGKFSEYLPIILGLREFVVDEISGMKKRSRESVAASLSTKVEGFRRKAKQ